MTYRGRVSREKFDKIVSRARVVFGKYLQQMDLGVDVCSLLPDTASTSAHAPSLPLAESMDGLDGFDSFAGSDHHTIPSSNLQQCQQEQQQHQITGQVSFEFGIGDQLEGITVVTDEEIERDKAQ